MAMLQTAEVVATGVYMTRYAERDYGQKFNKYETAGVREYWIINPLRERCDFNRRNTAGLFDAVAPDETGHYHTPCCPDKTIPVHGQAVVDL